MLPSGSDVAAVHSGGGQMLREAESPQFTDRLSGNPIEAIAAMRNQAVNAILLAVSVVGLPALAASLYRAKDVGWQTFMLFQIGLYLLVVGAAVVHRRLAFRVRVCIVLAVFFSLGV